MEWRVVTLFLSLKALKAKDIQSNLE
jgi:hypothetical protein